MAQDLSPLTPSSSASFVGADGEETRTLAVGPRDQAYNVTVFVAATQGELRIDVLDPAGSVVFATQSRPGEQLAKSGVVQTTAQGELRYRVVARGARNGSYQVFFQQQQ